MNHSKNIDEIIAAWLAGEAGAEEIKVLNAWVNEQPENKKYLEQFQTIWNGAEDDPSEVQTDKAWEKLQSQLKNKSPKSWPKLVYRLTLAAAASIGLFFMGLYIFNQNRSEFSDQPVSMNLLIQAGDSPYTAELPDKTTVTLMPRSSLTAMPGFGKKHRNIELSGSAYFKTVHGSARRLVVACGNIKVEDIGTAFWVYNFKNSTKVVVTEGIVKLHAFSDTLTLNVNDSATAFKARKQLVYHKPQVKKDDANQDKTLVFLKTELKQVVLLLNRTYGSHVKLGNSKIELCKLTASFKNESLETVLDVIRETFNLEIRKEGGNFILEGKGCQ